MKIPFFDKPNEDAPHDAPNGATNESSIIPTVEVEIKGTDHEAPLNIELYDHMTITHLANNSGIGGADFADALIPLAGNAANTATQYGQAIVRFPEGAG